MKTYNSNLPVVPIPDQSIYSFLFPEDDPHPSESPSFIDAITGFTLTRGDLRRLTLELAWGYCNELARLGGPSLKRGDTILIFSPNSVAYPVMLHGAFAAGLRATLANSAYTPAELAHQYHDSSAKLVVVHPSLVKVVLDMFKLLKVSPKKAKSRIVIAGFAEENKGPSGFVQVEQLFGKGRLQRPENFDGELSNETTLLCYSSGTTGKPKGVETTHKNLVSVCVLVESLLRVSRGPDVTIGALPFFHIYGAVNLLQYTLYRGVPVVCMQKFDPVVFCQTIERYKVTFVLIVPPILVVLARHPVVEQYDLRTLNLLVSGAAPLGAPLVASVTKRLQSRGCKTDITQGYGLTETSPTAHLVPREDAMRKIGKCGVLLPHLEARLVTEDGRDAKEGEPGELWLRGPTIMKGYHNNPEATRDSITDDKFFKTGDIATVDEDGFYEIVDRKKELIKYKGFQVPPAELESVLLTHPLIADAGVVGIVSESEATELPRAYVVHAQGLQSDDEKHSFADEVQKWIEGRVAKHKFLRGGVVVIDAVPKSAAGKILRRQLRDRAQKELAHGKTGLKAKL